jgi:hypothetical protein
MAGDPGFITFDPFILFLRIGETQAVTVRGGQFPMTVDSLSPNVARLQMPAPDLRTPGALPPPVIPLPAFPGAGRSVGLLGDPTTILVTGVAEGSAVLQAGTNSILEPGERRVLGTLTVNVRPAILQVFFHFVGGPPGVKTSRQAGSEATMLVMVNKVYNTQAGLEFTSAGTQPLLVPGLGSGARGVMVALFKTQDAKRIAVNAKPGVFFNVFFVGETLDGDIGSNSFGRPSEFLAVTDMPSNNETPRRCCIMRDPRRDKAEAFINFGLVLAHEAGHALDQPDSDDPDVLMSGSASTRGVFIPPRVAQDMRDSIKKFP